MVNCETTELRCFESEIVHTKVMGVPVVLSISIKSGGGANVLLSFRWNSLAFSYLTFICWDVVASNVISFGYSN